MPSQMPSSFASAAAAASQGANRDSRMGRGEGRGAEWSRRDNRSTNGTLTFRRSSNAPHIQPSQAESLPTPSVEASEDVPPPPNPSYDQSVPADLRYSKARLLDMYKAHRESKDSGASNGDVSRLFEDGWNPGHSNGTNGRAWGKTTDGRETFGPDACWDMNGSQRLISLEEMTDEEKNLFSTDVNSPMKPPPQNQNKDASGQGPNANGRKTSVSHGSGNSNFGLSSPASSRPGTRRRETSDSVPFSAGLGSPAGNGRFPRDESSPFFSRKLTISDLKDEPEDRPEEPKSSLPFGGLMRSNTTGIPMANAPLSPWGPAPPSATMSPMGTFGAFAMPNPTTPSDKRNFSNRAESRLAHLMPKDNTSEESQSKPAERSWRNRPRTDTDPFGGDDSLSTGASILGGGLDTSPSLNPQRKAPGLDTPIRGLSSDFGMSDVPSFRDVQMRAQNHQTTQGHNYNEPLSPDTNPFRSPAEERRGDRTESEDPSFAEDAHQHRGTHGLGGIPEHAPNTFGNLARNFGSGAFDGSDRSQTSSVGATRGFSTMGGLPSLSNIGSMGGWPTNNNMVSTPDREVRSAFPSAFGNSIFGPMGELPSPVLGSMGGMFGSGVNSIGRGSKLGSLFPPAMQAQMQGAENDNPNELGDLRPNNTFGAIGRGGFPGMRDAERHDPFAPDNRNQGPFSSAELQSGTTIPQGTSAQSNYQPSQTSSDAPPPNAQQRMMVMPDRMRWVYLDSQGQAQGPWSGLEMHDWYKASFFTADLSVKKLEDAEFEPLGQLIRRIGNSREPFLVPQIGIPHGSPATQPGPPFTSAAAAPAVQPGAVQPPFAGAFPSFGTTLTAEQQNNLERRKQEEQYLMARQREFLAQQQVSMKQMQMGGLPSTLHHHSSAHSLQSQPSFGSITSPIAMPPQPPMPGGISGFFDAQARQGPSQMMGGGMPNDFMLPDDLARLGLQDRPQPVGPPTSQAQQINALFGQPQLTDAQREAARAEQARQNDPQGFKARLREFEQLRADHDQEEAAQASSSVANEPIGPPAQSHVEQEEEKPQVEEQANVVEEKPAPKSPEVLSLTQQVQKAASAAASSKPSPISAPQPDSPWAKVNTSLPMPFPPPPQSTTPLPAPHAQRGRSGLPDTLHAEVRSRSETPETTSAGPTLAPWAVQPVEAPKGPSLKEIQEAEAKKAAKAEEAAAAARRVLLDQEMKMLANQPAAPAPGLPTTSTWGNIASPATPSNAPSAWAKPAAVKTPTVSNAIPAKKTLADIQREEESRKKKLAATTAVTQAPATTPAGKRYADLASKSSAAAPAVGGSWSTVGAGGKVKIPTGPAATAPSPIRSVSSAAIANPAARTIRPSPSARSVTMAGSQAGVSAANEEFKKWAKATLGAKDGLDSNINATSVDEFILMLSSFPPEVSIIADSVYSNSKVMDGRRFAEEYIRRHKLAEKGIVEPANTSSADKSGGEWSEVAKKGPPKEEPTAGFKVVPNKKKGKK
ncbi:GYF domain-containing protein [Rutstroemia sp. NJR-2017a BBW]|nr:GYF domain-containing protein [Rutstroemia sp. NJR-2017a BBW]